MNHAIETHDTKGRILWLRTDTIELGIALDYGIRILHLSCVGEDNLLYEQPKDLSDNLTTPEGWRIYGGHRYWTAPESEKSYYPDNAPVSYELSENGATITQSPDPWLGVEKKVFVEFTDDGNIRLTHSVKNVATHDISCASWGVTTFDSGSKAQIKFDGVTPGAYNPQRHISLWSNSALTDERIRFEQDHISATHLPKETSYKIGIFSHSGFAKLTNKGQEFTLSFEADSKGNYPDGGCNFELYMDKNVLELEALGQLSTLKPGESTSHLELWTIKKI